MGVDVLLHGSGGLVADAPAFGQTAANIGAADADFGHPDMVASNLVNALRRSHDGKAVEIGLLFAGPADRHRDSQSADLGALTPVGQVMDTNSEIRTFL